MKDKELIKEEIEKQIDYAEDDTRYTESYREGLIAAYQTIKAFVNSLPEESGCEVNCTTKNEGLEEEIDRFVYSLPHSADGFWPKDIDCYSQEARIKYGVRHSWNYETVKRIASHFAEWQKQQMVKDAVETTIVNDWQYGKDPDYAIIPAIHQRIEGFNIDDRVKIIIVKED